MSGAAGHIAPAIRDIERAADASGPAFDARDMRFFADAMRMRVGVVLPDEKAALVFRRLAPRVRELGLASFAKYRERLADPEDPEWDHIVGLLTTNHSRFFREIHHFKLLSKHLELAMAGGARRLRLWSAACAAGQEPYSMAMLISHLSGHATDVDARVLATDVDRTVLAAAVEGRYGSEDIGHLPRFARQFMTKDEGGMSVVTGVPRDIVRFRYHNLIGEHWPMRGPFDAIFCRNMLIYLSPPDQTKVIRRLAGLLKVGGLLCLGHSEVARAGDAPLRRVPVPSSYVRI